MIGETRWGSHGRANEWWRLDGEEVGQGDIAGVRTEVADPPRDVEHGLASLLSAQGPIALFDPAANSALRGIIRAVQGYAAGTTPAVIQVDMMIVVSVDPLHLQHGDEPWKLEKASLNLVADFVASMPK